MNQDHMNELLHKHHEYLKCMDSHYGELLEIATDVQRRMRDAYALVHPTRDCAYNTHRWVEFADNIDIIIENSSVIAQYVEIGRCGNSDEIIHELSIERLTTEQSRIDLVNEWIEVQRAMLCQQELDDQAQRLAEIEKLERRLADLRVQSNNNFE